MSRILADLDAQIRLGPIQFAIFYDLGRPFVYHDPLPPLFSNLSEHARRRLAWRLNFDPDRACLVSLEQSDRCVGRYHRELMKLCRFAPRMCMLPIERVRVTTRVELVPPLRLQTVVINLNSCCPLVHGLTLGLNVA